ncbi:MAG: hypothetical protein FK734_01750 [Asgard group archaeon]|nr:hypothetical protein [Asgard group archaeon]
MKEFLLALANLNQERKSIHKSSGQFILGEDFLLNSRGKLKRCILCSRLTRKIVTTAVSDDVKLIITIYPPYFFTSGQNSINLANQELLKMLLENNIAIYSIGEKWFSKENGGFDFILQQLEFQYTQELTLINIADNRAIVNRFGERKKTIKMIDLLALLKSLFNLESTFLGYNQFEVKSILIVHELIDSESIYTLFDDKRIDLVLAGEVTYEALLTIQQVKLPLIIIERRNIENIVLSNIQRNIMENVSIDIPEIIIMKQEEIGNKYDN